MSIELATNLVRLRGERNLTQQQLADAIGITPSQISRYESASAHPRKTVVFKLAEALGVSVADLDPHQRLRMVVGDPLPLDPPSKLRQRMFQDFERMDSEQLLAIRAEAEAAGVPFEEYITKQAEEGFLKFIDEAAKAGDVDKAGLYLVFASLLFGTNVKILDEREAPSGTTPETLPHESGE